MTYPKCARRKIRRRAKQFLLQHFRELAPYIRPPTANPYQMERALIVPPSLCRCGDSYLFYYSWTHGWIANKKAAALQIRGQEEQFRAFIEDEDRILAIGEQERTWIGSQLVCYFSGVFAPCASFLRRYDLVLESFDALVRRFTAKHHERVRGAGSRGDVEEKQLRFFLLGPAIRSLALHYPGEMR